MTRALRLCASPLIFCLTAGFASAADLRAEDLWKTWQSTVGLTGLTLDAAGTQTNADGLTLTKVRIKLDPTAAIEMETLVLRENADGSVAILPGEAALVHSTPHQGRLALSHQDLQLTARETDAGALRYDYQAAQIGLDLQLNLDGGTTAPSAISIAAEAVSGHYSDTPGDLRSFELALKTGLVKSQSALQDRSMGVQSSSSGEIASLDFLGNFALPAGVTTMGMMQPGALRDALTRGLAVQMQLSQGKTITQTTEDLGFFNYNLRMTAAPSEMRLAVSQTSFTLDGTAGQMDFHGTSPELAGPVDASLASAAFALKFPILSPETAQDYHLRFSMNDFALSEATWTMFDPNGALVHAPGRFNLDLGGTMRADLPGALDAAIFGGMPVFPQPEKLEIRDVTAKGLGVAMKIFGAFTFDSSQTIPTPTGRADLVLSGMERLLTGLTTLMPQEKETIISIRETLKQYTLSKPGVDENHAAFEVRNGTELYLNGKEFK